MRMPESRYAKTGDVKDHNTFDMDALKQYGRDLLEAAAVECETQCRNIAEKLYGKDLAVTIRSMKETP